MDTTEGQPDVPDSSKGPSNQAVEPWNMSAKQKKFIRELLKLVEANSGDDETARIGKGESVGKAKSKKDTPKAGAQDLSKRRTRPKGDETDVPDGLPADPTHLNESKTGPSKASDKPKESEIARFRSLRDKQDTHIDQIQASLKALGGGGRTKNALEDMRKGVKSILDLFDKKEKNTENDINIRSCIEGLQTTIGAANKVEESFKELKIFNSNFHNKLKTLKQQLEETASVLESEYDDVAVSIKPPRAGYLHTLVLGSLARKFENFLGALEAIADKEIAALQKTQKFNTQGYLLLTTVSTFLSSVTATTLAITTNDNPPPSVLGIIVDTLWFISLVFSTASAVYSLLYVTWLQSPIRQPDICLKNWPWVHGWLHSGPRITLIIALLAFSAGLCVLAFQVSVQQEHLALAYVPISFAGIHVFAIALISVWFISEKLKPSSKAADETNVGDQKDGSDPKAIGTNGKGINMKPRDCISRAGNVFSGLIRQNKGHPGDEEDPRQLSTIESESDKGQNSQALHDDLPGLVTFPEGDHESLQQSECTSNPPIQQSSEWQTFTCDNCKIFPIDTVRWRCDTCIDINICDACYNRGDSHQHPLQKFGLPDYVYEGIWCNECGKDSIAGVRWVCQECDGYDLCNDCGRKEGVHEHNLSDVKRPSLLHEGVRCDNCKAKNIIGLRWKCSVCKDYDLCDKCYNSQDCHNEHRFRMMKVEHSSLVHPVYCDGCEISSIVGKRWKCRKCAYYDLCDTCHAERGHEHNMRSIEFPALFHPYAACIRCEEFIVGVRWKCRTCINYDLCDRCHSNPKYHEHDMLKIKYRGDELVVYSPFEKLLAFSPSGLYLAVGVSKTVNVCLVEDNFRRVAECTAPSGGAIKQLEWSSSDDLLVRSSKGVFVGILRKNGSQVTYEWMLASTYGTRTPRSLRWLRTKDGRPTKFICTLDTRCEIDIYDITNSRGVLQTYEVSDYTGFPPVYVIMDTAFFGEGLKYALCLVTREEPNGEMATKLIVVNTVDKRIESNKNVYHGQTSLTISDKHRLVLLHGSKYGVQLAELSDANHPGLLITATHGLYYRTEPDQRLWRPERMVTFHGKDDKIIIGVSNDEVVVLHRNDTDHNFKALHIFTTSFWDAIARNAVSFAVNSRAVPYMFAFLNEDGTVKVWAVQSNDQPLSTKFKVEDRRGKRSKEPYTATCRFESLPAPFN